ncbi:peroxide stress protein YaaA [Cryobacterium sp. PH31-O1]|uniref:YaaA family protein n=1 Tax=Cryobacterium sp. PH31-O1 TaxID=3046306 RepID=UPI0024BBB5C7|nr:peroxide stress protein YaaA [Cryobacterium sp. PH31-O1]MDJ0339406.1 peroxide stress protein YaaA [Cryobacterium sp. PH31-O1]
MLILLPPSETKRSGGEAVPLDFTRLAYPSLNAKRRTLARALVALSQQPDEARTALKLGRTQLFEIDRNREVLSSPTLPVIDRYTGVLFDGLDSATLSVAQREFAHAHLAVHSALLGPLAALDPIPAYRLSHDSRVPTLTMAQQSVKAYTLRQHWNIDVAKVLGQSEGLLLDFRSEAYVALGARPLRPDSLYLRVVADAGNGQKRALNHFNKKSKGEFTRALLDQQHDFLTPSELIDWARSVGIRLAAGAPGELELVVEQNLASAGRPASSTIYTGAELCRG